MSSQALPIETASEPVVAGSPAQTSGRLCTNCGLMNPFWRWECEKCETALPGRNAEVTPRPQADRSTFWSSLRTGCGTLILANITTNVLLLLAAGSGVISELGTLLCVNLALLVGTTTLLLKHAAQSREQKGEGPLDPAGIAVAVGIFILIQIVGIPLLQSIG